MSFTIETKKRKFHRVLDSISNAMSTQLPESTPQSPAPVPLSSSTDATTSTIKRARLSSEALEHVAVTPSKGLSSALRPPSTPPSVKSVTSSAANAKPNYVPWDRERFLERLQTFQRVDRWSPKPAPINEVAWAKRGWSCTGVMTCGCVGGCGKTVVVKLPDELNEDVERIEGTVDTAGQDDEDGDAESWSISVIERREVLDKLVEEYAALIINGHSERCLWKRKGCDDTIQHLPLTRPHVAVDALKSRYLGLLSIKSQLPSADRIRSLIDDDDADSLLKILPSDFTKQSSNALSAAGQQNDSSERNSNEKPDSPTFNLTAFKLALAGWENGGNELATCKACFRRLGLWLYTPKPDGKPPVYEYLDAIGEHKEYCPWVNSTTQSCDASGKVTKSLVNPPRAGWEVLAQDIRTLHRRQAWKKSREQAEQPGPQQLQQQQQQEQEADLENDEDRKRKDREWWSKIRRLRQALQVKGLKRSESSGRSGSATGSAT